MSLFSALSIASQSLLSHRRAITTTNRNLTNAYTKGYSREEPVIVDYPGAGVRVETVKRIFSKVHFGRLITENQKEKSLAAYRDALEQVESIFNDLQGSGLSQALTDFVNALQNVSVEPGNIPARAELLAKAKTLIGRIRDSYNSLSEIKTALVSKIGDEVKTVKNLLSKLADINKSLKLYADSPERLNQYLDERDRTLKELSNYLDVKVHFNENGTVNVYSAKGFALILDERPGSVSFKVNEKGNAVVSIGGVDITEELKSGNMGGELRGIEFINELMEKLNTFTSTLAEKFNDIHDDGYDLYGNKGGLFFSSDNGKPIDASNITLAFDDPRKFAAASSKEYLNSDNGNVKELIKLFENTVTELGKSFSEYYNSEIVSRIGSELEHVKELHSNSRFLLSAIEEKVKELSSVNTDEELINLTKFQRAYEAAARVVTVTDELLQTILGMVR